MSAPPASRDSLWLRALSLALIATAAVPIAYSDATGQSQPLSGLQPARPVSTKVHKQESSAQYSIAGAEQTAAEPQSGRLMEAQEANQRAQAKYYEAQTRKTTNEEATSHRGLWISILGPILVALVSGFVSYIVGKKNQRQVAELAEKTESVKSKLQEALAEKKAGLDYEYDARKRLYQATEPLLFQLAELSEDALHRIYSLARVAKRGDLGPDSRSSSDWRNDCGIWKWLSGFAT